jgi:hypothetical protein
VRNVDALAAAQAAILELSAATRSFRRYADDIAALAEVADADGSPAPEPRASRLSMSRTGDELHLRGVLTGDLGREVEGVLAAWADRLFHQRRAEAALTADLPVPGREEVQAEALREVLRRGHASDTSTTRAPVTDVTLVVRDPMPLDPGNSLWGRPRVCTDVRGIRFSSHTAELLACDPVVHALLVDVNDVPTALATAARFASDDQRRAAAVRDGGCVFPGCDAPPSWTDLHHVVHAHDGGPTELWNLASLCRRHHGVVHRRGWAMRTVEDQWFRFVSPSGAVIESQRHGRCRGRPPDPA